MAISPHLDDVALGCAGLVAAHPGAVVVTVMAGRPRPHPLTEWDRLCGFAEGDDVVGARRVEDENALRLLGARPTWLDFLDHQYSPIPPQRDLEAAIDEAIAGAVVVAVPLGLGHEDHLTTAAACVAVARRRSDKRWLVYEDAIFRKTVGGTDVKVARLRDEGFVLHPVRLPAAGDKQAAVNCYSSQVKGLGRLLRDAFRPEGYWTLEARA